MPMHVDGAILHAAAQHPHAAQGLLGGNLAIPLKRRLRLRDKQRTGHRHANGTALLGRGRLLRTVVGALHQARDALDIVVGFGGKADHEIELATAPAGGEGRVHGPEQVFLSHLLIDDVAQALRAGFRGERQTALLAPGHQAGHVHAEAVQTLARHGNAHTCLGVLLV